MEEGRVEGRRSCCVYTIHSNKHALWQYSWAWYSKKGGDIRRKVQLADDHRLCIGFGSFVSADSEESTFIEKKKGEKMKRIHVLIIVLLSLSILAAPHAYAIDANLCKKDIAKFCNGIEPGEGRLLKCLKLSEEKLTPPCKQQLTQIEKAVEEVQNACADDYAIFCSSLLPGREE